MQADGTILPIERIRPQANLRRPHGAAHGKAADQRIEPRQQLRCTDITLEAQVCTVVERLCGFGIGLAVGEVDDRHTGAHALAHAAHQRQAWHVVRMRADHQQVDAVQIDGFKDLAREKQRHTFKARALDREVLLFRIEQLSSRTLELADAFIDLARAESQTLKLVDVDLVGLVLDAADEVWPLANRHQVEVRVVADIEAAVRGEPRLLVRALVNLLNNAIKFSAAGSMVTVSVEQDEAMFSVAVADQGAGIALADQPRLFQPFHRLHEGAANAPSGSGLGLVFVKTVVDRHGGRIAVQSAPGLGSTFTLWLPRAKHRHDA